MLDRRGFIAAIAGAAVSDIEEIKTGPRLVPFPPSFDPMEPPPSENDIQMAISLSEFLVRAVNEGILPRERFDELYEPLQALIPPQTTKAPSAEIL